MRKGLKSLALVLAITLGGAVAQAWEWTSYCGNLDGNKWLLKAGIGYGYSVIRGKYKGDAGDWWPGKWRVYGSGFIIPIQGEFLLEKIPLGITAQVRPMFGNTGWGKAVDFTIMAGANYHVAPGPDWLDLYAGLGLGVHIMSSKESEAYWDEGKYHSAKISGAGFAFDAHIGATFMFNQHMGVGVEFGWPNYATASFSFAF